MSASSSVAPATRATRVSSRGQVTIPKSFREYLGIPEGGPVEFALSEDGAVVVRPRYATARPLRGLLRKYAQAPVSLEDIDKGIGEAIAGELNKDTDGR